jgi:hypothetical protein
MNIRFEIKDEKQHHFLYERPNEKSKEFQEK